MSSKIINIVVVCMFAFCVTEKANAGLIVGDIYSDVSGIQWMYVGSYDLADGEKLADKPLTYNGFEAAYLAFPHLIGGPKIALSSNNFDDYFDDNGNLDGFVNYLAFYDHFGTNGDITELAGDVATERGGALGYDAVGDRSAFVNDRAVDDFYLNHVFRSVSVSEPTTIAILSLGLMGLVARRLKKQ